MRQTVCNLDDGQFIWIREAIPVHNFHPRGFGGTKSHPQGYPGVKSSLQTPEETYIAK